MSSPKTAVLIAARKPSGHKDHSSSKMGQYIEEVEMKSSVLKPPTTHFYFGQNASIVKSSPFLEKQQQSAIEKVKLNETLSKPILQTDKDEEEEDSKLPGNGLSVTNYEEVNNDFEEYSNEKLTSVSAGFSSTVSSLSSETSSSSSSYTYSKTHSSLLCKYNNNPKNPSEKEFLAHKPNQFLSHNGRPRKSFVGSPAVNRNEPEPTQDQAIRAFELELAEGKSRLRKVFSSGSSPRKKHPLASFFDIQAVGVQSRPPPESSPPPLPPAPASGKCFASYSLRPVNGEVPRAPKLTNFGGASAESRKGRMVAPNGPSAREELMQAIRGKGGYKGLRKMANPLQQAMQKQFVEDAFSNKLGPLKPALGHVGLYMGLVMYTAAGALIFQAFEHPFEENKLADLKYLVESERENFMRFIFNGSWNSAIHRENIDFRLLDYEQTVSIAAKGGIDMKAKEINYQWSYIASVFFASTILTTIGYGHIAPVTTAGRTFCIFFAIVGIPFTLSVIADIGQIFATLLSSCWKRYIPFIKPAWKKTKSFLCQYNSNSDFTDLHDEETDRILGGNTLTAIFALAFLAFFLSIGSFIFTSRENWSFLDAFYFCFITMTTIGFGDIVPNISGEGKASYMLVCMIYILVGLAFTSTIIELVRRQYAESWRNMQELRAQIRAQMRLAAALKQVADQTGRSDIELEGLDFVGDLDKLKNNIAKYKKGKYGKGLNEFGINELNWIEKNSKKIRAITIFIHETSV